MLAHRTALVRSWLSTRSSENLRGAGGGCFPGDAGRLLPTWGRQALFARCLGSFLDAHAPFRSREPERLLPHATARAGQAFLERTVGLPGCLRESTRLGRDLRQGPRYLANIPPDLAQVARALNDFREVAHSLHHVPHDLREVASHPPQGERDPANLARSLADIARGCVEIVQAPTEVLGDGLEILRSRQDMLSAREPLGRGADIAHGLGLSHPVVRYCGRDVVRECPGEHRLPSAGVSR